MVANMFGKIFAIKGRLNCQNTISRLTREITRCIKQQGVKEKQINAFKRAESNAIKTQFSSMNQSLFAQMAIRESGGAFDAFKKADGSIDYAALSKDMNAYNQFNQMVSQQRMCVQTEQQRQLDELEEYIERLQETEIEPLKDLQGDMEAQKATEEGRLEAFKAMEQQEGQFFKDNIQGMFRA